MGNERRSVSFRRLGILHRCLRRRCTHNLLRALYRACGDSRGGVIDSSERCGVHGKVDETAQTWNVLQESTLQCMFNFSRGRFQIHRRHCCECTLRVWRSHAKGWRKRVFGFKDAAEVLCLRRLAHRSWFYALWLRLHSTRHIRRLRWRVHQRTRCFLCELFFLFDERLRDGTSLFQSSHRTVDAWAHSFDVATIYAHTTQVWRSLCFDPRVRLGGRIWYFLRIRRGASVRRSRWNPFPAPIVNR
mmetsp:Transcript_7142/g.28891  ORF Transcript_7142/g.28891 Transcript_7142/m.28891 type:complete len:245 (+) Transcript_7142:499-1233(+)